MKILLSALLGVSITAQPLVSEDVLEPSVQNEVDHALARIPTNLCVRAADPLRLPFATNGLSRAAIAVRLVSEQGADGRWRVGTNDVTRGARKLLEWCGQ